MSPLVVVLDVAAIAYGIVYGIVRARRSDWGRAMPVAVPRRPARGAVPRAGGQHRLEDTHTGSLPATELLRAPNAEACGQ